MPEADIVSIDGTFELELAGAVQYVEPTKKSRRWAVEAGWQTEGKVAWQKDALEARISSRIVGTNPGMMAEVGAGMTFSLQMSSEHPPPGEVKPTTCSTQYVYRGVPNERIKVSVNVKEFKESFGRWVELDTSACPRVEVLAPSDEGMLVRVSQPEKDNQRPLKGSLKATTGDARAIDLKPGADQAMVGFKWAKAPKGVFDFRCSLVNEADKELVGPPRKRGLIPLPQRYAIVEMFADGKPGEPVTKYVAETDGDAKSTGTARL